MTETSRPIPERLMAPWIEDNQHFLLDLQHRLDLLDDAEALRTSLDIRMATPCEPSLLGAVDAAVLDVPIGDILSILIQALHVDAQGETTFGSPIRITGVHGHDLSLARTPLRLMAECALLELSTSPTIADTSFWSMLMEVNQAITRYENGGAGNPGIDRAYHTLVREGSFLRMLENSCVLAMSKSSQTVRLAGLQARVHHLDQALVSDRELLGQVLQPGEYLRPQALTEGTPGHFGVEQRGFTASERRAIQEIYTQVLGVTYFKPHAFSRAFRVEARLSLLQDETWMMPLLAAISQHTAERSVEPWPQFLADWTTKRLDAMAKLYGNLNFPRTPYFDPARTLV